jgi:hypothetical protein
MASDEPLKTRALLLLSKGYESADEGAPFILDGDVARAAQVGAVDTLEHAAAVDYLVMEGAVEFVGDGYDHLPRSTTLYEITERGLEMLRTQGYLH